MSQEHIDTPTVLYCMLCYVITSICLMTKKSLATPELCVIVVISYPKRLFVILVFPFTQLSSYLTPKMPDFNFSLPVLTSLSLRLTTAASKVPAQGQQQMDTDRDNGCLYWECLRLQCVYVCVVMCVCGCCSMSTFEIDSTCSPMAWNHINKNRIMVIDFN